MKRAWMTVLAVSALWGCAADEGDFTDASEAAVEGQAHWSYEGIEEWGEHAAVCESGRRQSPVDIPLKATTPRASLKALDVAYAPMPLVVVNNGHTVQAQASGARAQTMVANGKTYRLVQMHFHAGVGRAGRFEGSEHTVDRRRYPMELHLVHANVEDPKDLAVVGVLLEEGKENQALAPIFANAPKDKSAETVVEGKSIDVSRLLPASLRYVTYSGSLTTPPCSETVTWYVLTTPVEVSPAQLRSYQTAIPGNSFRPVQPGARDFALSPETK